MSSFAPFDGGSGSGGGMGGMDGGSSFYSVLDETGMGGGMGGGGMGGGGMGNQPSSPRMQPPSSDLYALTPPGSQHQQQHQQQQQQPVVRLAAPQQQYGGGGGEVPQLTPQQQQQLVLAALAAPPAPSPGLMERMWARRRELAKLCVLVLVVLLAMATHTTAWHYLKEYLEDATLTSFQEFACRAAYPLVILVLLWALKVQLLTSSSRG
jgi:hypothetical protein